MTTRPRGGARSSLFLEKKEEQLDDFPLTVASLHVPPVALRVTNAAMTARPLLPRVPALASPGSSRHAPTWCRPRAQAAQTDASAPPSQRRG